MKRKLIISSLASIWLLTSIVAGSTYALFTSNLTHTIDVSTAKVEYSALIDKDSFKTYSFGVEIGTDVFENTLAGTKSVTYDELNNLITLSKMTPGDEIRFNIDITNSSSINTMYRVTFNTVDVDDGELSKGLEYGLITMVDNGGTLVETKVTHLDWIFLEKETSPDPVTCYVSLPYTAGNEYQTSEINISVCVEAIQGNADIDNLS